MSDAGRIQHNLPVPDPTLLTTEQLRRELSGLRELIEARLDGMDIAQGLLKENVKLVAIDTEKMIKHLQELHDEKFESIQTQFRERDVRSDQDKIAATTAVNAALQAQKEAAASQNDSNAAAITKSEAATTKQIDGIAALIANVSKTTDDKLGVINGRLDRGEGKSTGITATTATMLAVGALMVSLGAVLFDISRQSTSPTVVSPAVVPMGPK